MVESRPEGRRHLRQHRDALLRRDRLQRQVDGGLQILRPGARRMQKDPSGVRPLGQLWRRVRPIHHHGAYLHRPRGQLEPPHSRLPSRRNATPRASQGLRGRLREAPLRPRDHHCPLVGTQGRCEHRPRCRCGDEGQHARDIQLLVAQSVREVRAARRLRHHTHAHREGNEELRGSGRRHPQVPQSPEVPRTVSHLPDAAHTGVRHQGRR